MDLHLKTVVVAATAAWLALVPAAARAEPVCTVTALQGQAQLLVAGGAATALRQGQGLEVGAELRTGAGGRVRLRCVDGSTLVLADQSRLQIELFEPAAGGAPRLASFLLSVGLVGQKVQSAGGGGGGEGRWQVRTPSAVTAVRGTEFMVEVAAKDLSTAVHVLSGAVAVEAQDEQAAAAAASAGYISKSIDNLRGFKPPVGVLLQAAGASTRCAQRGGCSAAAAGTAAERQRLQGRLGGLL